MFAQLTVLVLAGLVGPLLAYGRRDVMPVVVGELTAGVVLGRTGFGVIDSHVQPLPAFAAIGFAMLMFGAGARFDVTSPATRKSLPRGLASFVVVVAVAVPLGVLVSRALGVAHPALVAVLIAGSSAALAFPILEEQHLGGPDVAGLMTWIALGDAVTVVVMPLTLAGTANLGGPLLGDLAVIAAATLILVIALRTAGRRPVRALRDESLRRGWALQLRVSVLVLFGLSSIAERTGGSTLVSGFASGMIIARLREPQRLALQISGLAAGFFVPFFFVLLGAQLDLRTLATEPSRIVLAFALMAGAVLAHVIAATLTGRDQPVARGLAASAQLGLPAAAASLGLATHQLDAAVAGALVGAGLLTLVPATIGARLLGRGGTHTRAVDSAPNRAS